MPLRWRVKHSIPGARTTLMNRFADGQTRVASRPSSQSVCPTAAINNGTVPPQKQREASRVQQTRRRAAVRKRPTCGVGHSFLWRFTAPCHVGTQRLPVSKLRAEIHINLKAYLVLSAGYNLGILLQSSAVFHFSFLTPAWNLVSFLL